MTRGRSSGKFSLVPKRLTPKRKAFVKRVLETRDIASSHMEVFGANTPLAAEEAGKKILTDPKAVPAIVDLWDKMGLSLGEAAKAHARVLRGKEKKIKGSDILKAVEMVYEGHGVVKKKDEAGAVVNVLQFFISQRRERGLSIPKEILEAEEVKEV